MAAANDDGGLLARLDHNDNQRQQSDCEGERFSDAYSKLDAYRYPLADQKLQYNFYPKWHVGFFDRYAFFVRFDEPLKAVDVVDLNTGVVRSFNKI